MNLCGILDSNNAAPILVFTHQHQYKDGDLAVSHPKGILKYQAETEFHFRSRLLL
jgi:hypothetical protein